MDALRRRTKLDAYYKQIDAIILSKQHPVTGLLPASTAVTVHGNYRDAWVRDNVYSILAVWGLGRAYSELDDDDGRGYELDRRTVHLMRGLLRSMMAQSAKVEAFKQSRNPRDSLHAKYDTETGGIVVGDDQWGHLQIDATSLFLLMLAQMTSSGLDIIWTMDEVNFIQNLVYYIERAYRTPDFGIWERGAKSNRGNVELNASSIGMAKAALEALACFNLFGAKGGQASVVHVAPDNIAQADITLTSMLPRESNTKEVDAAVLSIISYPAFAMHDAELVSRVKAEIVQKLEGRFGLKRFLRDGHQTVVEDEGRSYYEQSELRQFANIESEWPLFFCYLYLDALLSGDEEEATHYEKKLQNVLVEKDGFQLLPELYYVPVEGIELERQEPHSQPREPNDNVPLVWAQSLYLLGRMLRDGVLRPGDIDPLGRRRHKLPRQPVIQILFLAEDEELQAELLTHGVLTETLRDIAPVTGFLPTHIASVHGQIGRNDRLGLTGRSARALKSLMTSRFYRLKGETAVCLASFFTLTEFFLAYDLAFLVARFRSELAYLYQHWSVPGRPTVTVLLTRALLEEDRTVFYSLAQEIAAGVVDDIPVKQGRLVELLPTGSFERVDDINDLELPTAPLEAVVSRTPILATRGEQTALESSIERAIAIGTPTSELIHRLGTATNLYEQIELLEVLSRALGMLASVEVRGTSSTLEQLIEDVYDQAGRLRLWAIVRRAAGLLGKVDGDLSLAVGAILVRQKYIQVGRAYSDESVVTQPIPEHDLLQKIRQFSREDVRDRVLTQELILYIGLLIKADPSLFDSMLTIRLGQLISLLCMELAREESVTVDVAYERLMHLPPSVIQSRLERVLAAYQRLEGLPQELGQLHSKGKRVSLSWQPDLGFDNLEVPASGWLHWRQHHGIVDRRPQGFYRAVWHIFHRVPALIIGDKLDRRTRMESSVVVSDMTPDEQAFALWLEHLLNKFQSPEYRQLNIEALRVISSFFEQHASLQLKDALMLDAIIGHAVHLAYVDGQPEREANYNDHKAEAWEAFYTRPPAETAGYLVGALRLLLAPRATLPPPSNAVLNR